jgi:hypothetical protein
MKMPNITAADNGGKEFKKLPPGAHFAICNMMVDCGMQKGYQGKPQRKVYIRWEVPDERVEYEKDGVKHEGPCSIGKFYTLSLSEKATLRKDLENWRGKTFTDEEARGFNIVAVLGKCCQLMVTHSESNGKTYANVTGIMGTSKDQKARAVTSKPENDLIAFSVEDPDQEAFDRLPNWLKEKIGERIQEGKEQAVAAGGDEDFDDDIPF